MIAKHPFEYLKMNNHTFNRESQELLFKRLYLEVNKVRCMKNLTFLTDKELLKKTNKLLKKLNLIPYTTEEIDEMISVSIQPICKN